MCSIVTLNRYNKIGAYNLKHRLNKILICLLLLLVLFFQTALKLATQGQNSRIVQIGNESGSHTNHTKTNILNNSHGIKKET